MESIFLYKSNKRIPIEVNNPWYQASLKLLSGSDLITAYKCYLFVINRLKYDYDAASSIGKGYVPNLSEIYILRKGICLDYACAFKVMMIAQAIPCAIIFGYVNGEYHAWNEITINNNKIQIDCTQHKFYFVGKREEKERY